LCRLPSGETAVDSWVRLCTGDLITNLLAGNSKPWRQQQQQKTVNKEELREEKRRTK